MNSRIRKLRDGTEVAVHANDGVRKLCGCRRSKWTKSCTHPWCFSFKWKGIHHRFSLNRYVGRNIGSKTAAELQAERLRVAIKDGTFISPQHSSPQMSELVAETFEVYAKSWLRGATLNLKASSIRFYTDHLENHIFPAIGSRPSSRFLERIVVC